MAHLKRTEFGKVDLEYVLGIGGFDLERLFSAIFSGFVGLLMLMTSCSLDLEFLLLLKIFILLRILGCSSLPEYLLVGNFFT